MKRFINTLLFLCAMCALHAQISESGHWHNGSIMFSATNQAKGRVTMNAMDEGEEHEFMESQTPTR